MRTTNYRGLKRTLANNSIIDVDLRRYTCVMRDRLRLLILFGAAMLIFTAGFGLRDPWPPNEPDNALAAAEMLRYGNWLAPTLAGEIFADQGPLYLWILGAFQWLFGMRAGFLLPSLLSAIGILGLTWDLARRLWDDSAAFWSGAALLACVQFSLQAHDAGGHAVLGFFIVLGLYGFARHLLLGPAWAHLLLGCVGCGLGLMIHVSGLLPLLLFLPWLWALRRGWTETRIGWNWRWLPGLLVLTAIPATWLSLLWLSDDAAVSQYRVAVLTAWPQEAQGAGPSSWSDLKPFWYYLLQVAPWACFPLVLTLPWMRHAWKRRLAQRDTALLCLLAWVGAVLLLLSLSHIKRATDFLPVIPALAVCCGPALGSALQHRNCQRTLWIGMMAVLLVLLLAMLRVYGVAPADEPVITSLSDGSPFWFNLLYPTRLALLLTINSIHPVVVPLLIVASAAGLAGLLAAGSRRVAAVTGCVIVTFWLLLGWGAFSVLNEARSGKTITTAAQAALSDQVELGLADWRAQLLLHIDRPVTHFGRLRADRQQEILDAAAWLHGAPHRLLLAPEEYRTWCFRNESGLLLGYAHRRNWYLLGPEMLSPECRTEGAPTRVINFAGWR